MKIGKYKELACDLNDKRKYVVYIRNLNQALDHGLKLEKDHRGIKFNLTPYTSIFYVEKI